ncbi:hypothetical protein BA763_13510 [Burkholderia cenocepacia]|nr:hypothetical protein BA763_13510 [Burkholderia cenocepacia]
MEIDFAGPAAPRCMPRCETARASTVAPADGRLRISSESVARTLDERRPARIAGGPSCVIQAAKGAMLSPGLKHAPPDR